jgi:DNA-binding HxlR family transcriptional regulator
VPERRYPQFCPIARATEILGERWTMLIARELACGPQRYTDLRRKLPGISSSILSERLARLEERGLVARRDAPPPAPAALYEFTPLGRELGPVLRALLRFGVRVGGAPQPGDQIEPAWMQLALASFAREDATPARRFAVRIPDTGGDLELHVSGGRRGTRVRSGGGDADASLRAAPLPLLGLASGRLDPGAAIASGAIAVSGDATALRDFSALFDLDSLLARPTTDNPG